MLPLLLDSFNTLTQSSYDLAVTSVLKSRNSIACPCCAHKGTLCKHAYYERYYNINDTKLKILRLICKDCKSTHAVLPVNITAYSQVPTCMICSIIYDHMICKLPFNRLATSYHLDLKRIKRIINHFKQEYLKLHLEFFHSLTKLCAMTSHDINDFFHHYKLLYLVNRERLKTVYVRPHPIIISLHNP